MLELLARLTTGAKVAGAAGLVLLLAIGVWAIDHGYQMSQRAKLERQLAKAQQERDEAQEAVADRDQAIKDLRRTLAEQKARLEELRDLEAGLRDALRSEAARAEANRLEWRKAEAKALALDLPADCKQAVAGVAAFLQSSIPRRPP